MLISSQRGFTLIEIIVTIVVAAALSAMFLQVMSTNLTMASPADGVEDTMGLMTSKRIRHLPVVTDGRLVGLVSIGDVVKAHHDHLEMENQFMKDYIHKG